MADEAVLYTLTTSVGSVAFNSGDLHTFDDVYWIQDINGLDAAPIRAPVDNKPQTHGGILHNFWRGPMQITFSGVILVQSVPLGGYCLAVRNQMEEDLRANLDAIVEDTAGVLTWTPTGDTAKVIHVRHNIPVEFQPAENYAIKAFTFGLVSEYPLWWDQP